jgi:hypothetical protein
VSRLGLSGGSFLESSHDGLRSSLEPSQLSFTGVVTLDLYMCDDRFCSV